MKRLLLVDQFGHLGGGQVVLHDVAAGAVSAGIETHLAAPAGPAVTALAHAGVVVHELQLPVLGSHHKSVRDIARYGAATTGIWLRLERLARDIQPNHVHVNGGRVLPQAALAPHCRPLSFHAHTAYASASSRRLAGWSLRLVKRPLAIAPSPFMRRWTIRNLGLEPREVVLAWNWVDDRLFDCSSASSGLPSTKRVVVLGRVTPLKGQLTAVRAFKSLPAAERSAATLEVLGPVDCQSGGTDYARRLATEAAGHGAIACHFEHVDTLAALSGADVCIVPSQFQETFGLVAAEAMAAGVPVIVSDIGALPEVAGDAGIRVPPGDVAALGSALSALLNDDAKRRALAAAGRHRASRLFTRERQVSAVLETLEHHARQSQ